MGGRAEGSVASWHQTAASTHLYHASVVPQFELEAALVLDYGVVNPSIARVLAGGRDWQGHHCRWRVVEGRIVGELVKSRGGPLTIAVAATIGQQT
jgi:hypothetical protein